MGLSHHKTHIPYLTPVLSPLPTCCVSFWYVGIYANGWFAVVFTNLLVTITVPRWLSPILGIIYQSPGVNIWSMVKNKNCQNRPRKGPKPNSFACSSGVHLGTMTELKCKKKFRLLNPFKYWAFICYKMECTHVLVFVQYILNLSELVDIVNKRGK